MTLLILLTLLGGTPQDTPTTAPDDRVPNVTARVERRTERFDYHIENPSNVEPGPLVPHFFEQRYRSNNTWFFVNVGYRLAGSTASTEFGVTPRITTPGSDVDTFFSRRATS